MSDWTPGPWSVEAHEHVDGGVVLRSRVVGPAVVRSNFPLDTPEGQQAEADARLIAAAPEMAELLEKLWGWLANYYTEAPPEFQADLERALRLLERLESHE